eukprot:CAMPEP_0185580414 /NCGR_PEP_ID=MMETSP0434-20130131/16412_1 /TAXON_ID=626734 ORGANISM="Favella taraikaensis, Strain Fe Narragansett Bay" /NCGR_SAMPLE_ID=MMETSP0434 /ASSEMBLY_ACC=CAM_ASM_000379 /LENGTH=115 /DNA_ID=CAMNT_0028198665 /DNA_START=1178 /DNA_END=1525 /DNA_ORIENTATION=-
MSEPTFVHVGQARQELAQHVARQRLCKPASQRNQVEQLATSDELQYEILDEFLALVRMHLVAASNFDKSHDIFVLRDGAEDIELGFQEVNRVLMTVHDLDCVSVALIVAPDLHFA